MDYASSSAPSAQVEDKVVKMETELATLKEQMNSLLAYIATRSDVPKHFTVMAPSLVSASNTFCYRINMYILLQYLIFFAVNISGIKYCKWCYIPKSHYRIKWRQQGRLNIYVLVFVVFQK